MKISWTDFKPIIDTKGLSIQYTESLHKYYIYGEDSNLKYECVLFKNGKNTADVLDFETNYKSNANKSIIPLTKEGKPNFVASSRPKDTTTCFTMVGDSPTEIGAGKDIYWDFSNTIDDVVSDVAGFKKKQIDVTFNDYIWIKEGALYFHNALKGSFVKLEIICPSGYPYKKNDGSYAVATTDTVISRYIMKHFFQGTCPMGDELNTEESQEEGLPPGYIVRFNVYVPDSDNSSNGYISLELYRAFTVKLV